MNGLKENSKNSVKKSKSIKELKLPKISKEMNWLQIDKILWDMISQWDGKNKEALLEHVSKAFNWTEKQSKSACEMHFIMYNKKNT